MDFSILFCYFETFAKEGVYVGAPSQSRGGGDNLYQNSQMVPLMVPLMVHYCCAKITHGGTPKQLFLTTWVSLGDILPPPPSNQDPLYAHLLREV